MQISSSSSYNPYSYANNSSKNSEVQTKSLNETEEVSATDENETSKSSSNDITQLTPEEKQVVSELQARDTEVRTHEAAHLAAAGGLATGGPSFTYQKGPDGIQYAIGGEVPLDTSEGSTPEETITRARQIQAAALAPADPSPQDIKIASSAAIMEMKAVMELSEQKQEEANARNKTNPYETSQEGEESSPLNLIA